ncbi:hypothetical protein GCM10009838_82630 [Catenulispora subtropica]|uniref:Uncharacterized protein n=1 Tax=Catenulispora subtropica TaxID=450798 RepID=A0ABN2TBI7_9ACTN
MTAPQAILTAAVSRCTPAPFGVVLPSRRPKPSFFCLESAMTRTRRPRPTSAASASEAAKAAREALQEALDRRSR